MTLLVNTQHAYTEIQGKDTIYLQPFTTHKYTAYLKGKANSQGLKTGQRLSWKENAVHQTDGQASAGVAPKL